MSEVINETAAEEAPEAKPTSLSDLKPKMKLTGTVSRLELYGAFIDIGLSTNALIHISQLGTEHVNRVADVLNVGDEVTVWVDKVNPERDQVMVTMIEPLAVEWSELKKGQVHTGTVSRLENFGAFIDVGAEREGLVHISELSHDFVKHPSEVVSVGDEVQVQVLGFSKRKRRIDLSIKALAEKPEPEAAVAPASAAVDYEEDDDDELPTAMELALRQALGESMPPSSRRKKSGKKRRRKRDKMREQQEDILDRTLQVQQNGG
jgi:small subunit ribosomal protein S1